MSPFSTNPFPVTRTAEDPDPTVNFSATFEDVNISEGSSVWVEDPNIVWIDGQVKSINGDEAVVSTSDEKKVVTKLSKLYPKDDDTPVGGVDDMTRLSYLHEPGVFYNLATRYQLNNIYTYTGRILIAINPFQRLPDLYETHIMEKYKGVRLGELPPHVFAIADVAYRAVMNEGKSNSILVSGESGAGKTETTKMLMQYLAYLGGHRGGEQRTVEQQVLESNPVLEAFGNAKTVRNDNSSRFGKFVEIQFDKRGRISGAAIRTYLLEKSRVCQTSDPERNYHCFYYLCAAPPEDIETYKLGHPTKFHYLNQSSCNELDGVSDGQQYLITRQAMNVVGISESEQDAIFRVVAAILHLGNVTFAKGEETAILENEKSKFHLHTAAELLKCSIDAFEDAILKRVMVTPEDFIKRSLDPGAAAVSRDGLSKTLYSRLFDWLVDKINVSIGQDSNSKCLIGVLDIYGFESFKYNSFEQFCINLTNEKLQQHFNQHIFKMQQEEYAKEEIDWSYIEFVDNQDILDLMEKKHGGIIALLDEACMFPKSTAQTFAEKLYQTFKSNKRFIKPKLARTEFTISHYAGEVQYQSDQFMEKNKDYVVPEHLDLLIASECPFVSGLFPPVTDDSSSKSSNKCSKFSSIGSRFRLQLYQLMETLNSTDPHYIRCVKPNNHFKPGLFENSNVLHQLRCGGVLEAIRISCLGYPTHKTFSEFLRRFGVLAPEILKENEDERVACKKIMEKMGISGAQIGKTKVFLRANQMADLDGHRLTKLGASSKIIQRNAKGYIARKDYVAERKAAISIQSIYRGLAARKTYANKIQDLATLKIQKTLRGLLDRKSFTRFKDSVIILQTGMRKLGARMMFSQYRYRKQNKKATVIQTYWRRHRAYSYYKRLPLVSVVIQCGWRGMVARTELQKMQVAAAALREAALKETALREAALQEAALREAALQEAALQEAALREAALQETALREAALQEANNELEKQVEDLTLLSEHERSLRVDLEKDMDEEITNMQHSVDVMQTKVDASDASLIQEDNVMQTKVMQTKVDASNTSFIIIEGNIMQTKVDASNTSLLEEGSVMQTKVDASNASLLKECNINREVIEEDSSNIEESVVTVGDNAKIAALTSEVAKLKNLLQCERERADKMEKLYTEALESAQGKRRKLEETERRVNQLQESLNRMISAMSGQFSELKLILSSSSNSSSTSGFPVLEHMEDDSSSSSTASSDSDFTFPAPTSIPPNFSISPGAFHLIVQDLSAAEVSGTENWEGEREGAFDDFF